MDEKVFKFHWLDGKTEIGKGSSVSIAFMSLGYSGGALRALDYYEEEKDGPTQN